MKFVFIPNSPALQSITIAPCNAEYELIRGTPQGFGGVRYVHMTSQTPNQNGRTYYFSRADSRSMSFSFRIYGQTVDDVQSKKLILSQTFSPSLGEGTLRVYTDSADTVFYDIACVPDGIPSMFQLLDGHNGTVVVATVSFTAANPLFVNPQASSVTFTAYMGGFQLPFRFPFTLGEYGAGLVSYAGSSPTPAIITIPGPFTNPVLTNTRTGETISITESISADERLEINTDPATSYVHLIDQYGNITNKFSALSLDSVLWQIYPGDNYIQYSDSEVLGNIAITVSWYERFEGVL